ncbi:hypothetical protein GCM10009718_04540 [Isoptericola halotolerans]|uniref:M23 family peptidase n=1 Tax=Isoptericola halotolerans TaxID=300560 RepID=A0ABX2A193_9MICO|nr:hypothetical protein [Isoptericola halotolerans]NOV96622.1 hypothetical protein [Isoptericola halotolerans]
MMAFPFRKKSLVRRATEALGGGSKRSGSTAVRTGLVSLGTVAGVTALSAAVSAIRDRQDAHDQEDQDDRS